MTLLMVTPYPPYRDGIGAYAVQEIRRLRASGTDVEVLSPLPSAAHHHLALGNTRGVLALVKRGRRYDSVVIQFSPEMMFGSCRNPAERVAVWLGLEALARVTSLEIRLHEIEFGPLRRNPGERMAAGRALRAASAVTVHTRPEISNLASVLKIDPDTVTLVEHGQNFAMATEATQAEARAELGLDADQHVFLAIGFLQEHKGFDLAVEAFGRAGLSRIASLHVVGSVRVNHPDLISYAKKLELQCGRTAGVTLHQKYVNDAEFDRWIVAADTVVLPYREIWSSSVFERAKLYDRPVIAADVGGMSDQATTGTFFFEDTESLIQALKERAQGTVVASGGAGESGAAGDDDGDGRGHSSWSVDPEQPNGADIEAQIRARARGQRTGSRGPTGERPVSDALLSVGPVARPGANSARPGVSSVKRMIRRLTNWEFDPVISKVEALHRATTDAVEELEARIEHVTSSTSAERLIEEPFIHGALADLALGRRVLLVDDGGMGLARSMAAAGHTVSVLSAAVVEPNHPAISNVSGPLSADETVRYDVIIVTSAALGSTLMAEPGWLAECRRLLADDGRVVLSLPYQKVSTPTVNGPYDRGRLAELLQGWTIRYLSVGLNSPGRGWELESTELVEPSGAQRLVLFVVTR